MKLRSLVLAALLAPGCISVAHAQGTRWFALQGGTALPRGPFFDDAKTGMNAGGSYVMMLNDYLGVGGDIQFYRWNGEDRSNAYAESLYGPGSRLRFGTWQYTIGGILAPAGQRAVQPYLKVGGGVYNVDARFETSGGYRDAFENHLGLVAGGGLNLRVSQALAVGVTGTFHAYENEPQPTSYLMIGTSLVCLLPSWSQMP